MTYERHMCDTPIIYDSSITKQTELESIFQFIARFPKSGFPKNTHQIGTNQGHKK
jgi:hypothetical protein